MISSSAVLCFALSVVVAAAADISYVPYQVSLQLGRNHFCGGSIISPDWILTSSHCVEKKYPWDIQVVAGTNSLYPEDAGAQRRKVDEIIRHPLATNSVEKRIVRRDVALLKLEKPLTLGRNVQVIKLDKEPIDLPERLIVAGWGVELQAVEAKYNLKADKLGVKGITVQSEDDCSPWAVYEHPGPFGFMAEKNYNPVSRDFFVCGDIISQREVKYCDGGDNLNGGPAKSMHTDEQVAIISFGNACGRLNRPAVFTKLHDFLPWIEEKTGLTL